MMLEAALHGDNAFVTLTYNDENLPENGCLDPREIQLFLKKLRKQSPRIRFFACGEYGDQTQRPHYHLALFGFPTCLYSLTRKREYCCRQCELVKNTWGKGHAYLGTLENNAMAYVASYINKKMTKATDPRLEGRTPEFARMSLRPGIGYNMMHEVANTLLEHNLEKKLLDVPISLQHGKKRYPLGRYLRRSLRALIGRDKNAPPEAIEEYKKTLLPMRHAAFENSASFKSEVLKKSEGRRIQIEAHYKRSGKRSTI
ncbi:MAG: replication initiator protein [Arizlama microvirus]|nr:MAG: replication initiator protein [Arizlama microvirus]